MSNPLLRCSSNPATTVDPTAVGQAQGSSSSPVGAADGDTGGRLATGAVAVALRGALAVDVGVGVLPEGMAEPGETGRATATSMPPKVVVGGITRRTWP